MFDPTIPADHAPLQSAPMRTQLIALFDLIQSIPVGPQGPPGPGVNGVVVDNVNTLNPGDPASVGVSFDGIVVHFTFNLPRGDDGLQGAPGAQGATGVNAVIVDGVDTLNPGEAAQVSAVMDGPDMHFSFGIPRGHDGLDGAQGPPGEVTTADMNAAIATAINGTSANTNAVATLDDPFVNDPPTLADMELMRGKMNELITALRR